MVVWRKLDQWLTDDGLASIELWAKKGLTLKQIAHNMDCTPETLSRWKKQHPQIEEAIRRGYRPVELELENALHKAAMGYEFEETVTTLTEQPDGTMKKQITKYKKFAKPDATALIFYLKNLNPERWRRMSPTTKAKIDAERRKLEKEIEKLEYDMQPSESVEAKLGGMIDALKEAVNHELA